MITERAVYGYGNMRFIAIAILSFGLAAAAGCTAGEANNAASHGHQTPAPAGTNSAKLDVPSSIAAEHRELHEALEAAVRSGGKTGEAAKVVEERLSVHFEKEEQYALPQLGLLETLASGSVSPDMNKAIELSDKLKAEMPRMMEEHKGIVEALNNLKSAAQAEKNQPAMDFADFLGKHARNEEQITYPAAILVGEYLKLKLNQGAR